MKDNLLYESLFELIGYLLTSSQGLLHEPQEYGPFRLLEGASKLCAILENEETQYREFFKGLKEQIDEGKFSLMSDMEAFIKCIDESVSVYVRKVKEINTAV